MVHKQHVHGNLSPTQNADLEPVCEAEEASAEDAVVDRAGDAQRSSGRGSRSL